MEHEKHELEGGELYAEEYEAYPVTQIPWWMQKAVPVLVSACFHLVLLYIAAFIVFSVMGRKGPPPINVSTIPFEPQELDLTAPSGLFNAPEIEADIKVERPIVDLVEDYERTKDIPKGTSLSHFANKEMGSDGIIDIYGPGGGRAGAYGERWGKGRLANEGGSRKTICVVDRALRWLHYHQDRDGKWDQDGFSKNCDSREGPACENPGTGQYDVAVSSLALLAFLGHGNSHRVGYFKKTVSRGLDWLLSQQKPDGSLGERSAESWMYNHAIGTMALCEAFAMSRDYRLREPAQRAVDYIRAGQNPGLGWKYEPQDGRNDTSVTGWMVLALKAAKAARLNVDQSLFEGAINWFDRATNTEGKTGYMRPGDNGSVIRGVNDRFAKLPTMTGVAVLCRIFCGQSRRDPQITRGVDILMQNLPVWNKPNNDMVDMYYWYYATYAMFQFGGAKWDKWNQALHRAVIDTQRNGGCADGSWDPVGKWGMVGGRVYATAINALTMEIYYRYKRVVTPASASAKASGR
jgi:hypothetical protein